MRNRIAALLLTIGLLICGRPAIAAANSIEWYKDLRAASAAAQEADKPMMIEFLGGLVCAPCKIMEARARELLSEL